MSANPFSLQDPLPEHDPVNITLSQTISLISALISLKFLHAIASIFGLGRAPTPSPPLDRLDSVPASERTADARPRRRRIHNAIERRENRILGIFVAVMPTSFFENYTAASIPPVPPNWPLQGPALSALPAAAAAAASPPQATNVTAHGNSEGAGLDPALKNANANTNKRSLSLGKVSSLKPEISNTASITTSEGKRSALSRVTSPILSKIRTARSNASEATENKTIKSKSSDSKSSDSSKVSDGVLNVDPKVQAAKPKASSCGPASTAVLEKKKDTGRISEGAKTTSFLGSRYSVSAPLISESVFSSIFDNIRVTPPLTPPAPPMPEAPLASEPVNVEDTVQVMAEELVPSTVVEESVSVSASSHVAQPRDEESQQSISPLDLARGVSSQSELLQHMFSQDEPLLPVSSPSELLQHVISQGESLQPVSSQEGDKTDVPENNTLPGTSKPESPQPGTPQPEPAKQESSQPASPQPETPKQERSTADLESSTETLKPFPSMKELHEENEQMTKERNPSADSFPGKFPVSEGTEYSDLASAQEGGKGMMSSRPLSDI